MRHLVITAKLSRNTYLICTTEDWAFFSRKITVQELSNNFKAVI